MPAPLRCPTCSAPLDVPAAHADTMRCTYCGAAVLLTERLGTTPSPEQQRHADAIAEVLRELRAGSKIGAVKVYRERFGVGLAEAKHAVERLEAGQHGGATPTAAAVHIQVGQPSASTSTGTPSPALLVAALAMVIAAGAGALFMRRSTEVATPPAATQPATTPLAPARPTETAAPPGFAAEALRFGSEGTGAGRFEDARSVAVDGAGRIYVAEYTGGRVQVFDSAGTFVTQWMADRRMPLLDLAADRAGTVYSVQSGRIRRFEGATGRALGEWRARGSTSSYSDVALALDGTLWTVSGMSEVAHLDRDGRVIRGIDLHQAVDEDASAARVAVAGTGDVYVLDRWTGEIYHLDADGRFRDRFGGRGQAPGEGLRAPQDLAIDGRGRVYVSDMMGGIHVFDADGRFLEEFGDRLNAFGITVNDRDELFATNRNDAEIVKFRLTR